MNPNPSAELSEALPLRHNRRFRSLFAAETVSGFGDRIHIFALLLLVHAKTGRTFDLGLLAIVQVLPGTVMAPLAGWVIDRVERRRLMMGLDLLQAFLVLLLPLTNSLGQILFIAALLAIARQFADPARMAVLPEIVRDDQVLNANGALSSVLHLLLIVGPAAAGLLAGRFGLTACFRVDAATYLLSAVTLIGLGRCPRPAAKETLAKASRAWREFFGEIREGLSVLTADTALRFTIVFFALGTFISSMQQPLVVVFVKDVLQGSDPQLGTLISMMGVGGILGSIMAPLSKRWVSATLIMPIATVLDGGALVAFGLATHIAPAMALFGAFGFVAGMLQVRVTSLFQARVPQEYRGRAFSWLGPLFGPLSVASLALGTWIADATSVVKVIIASGALEIAVALLALLWLAGHPALAAVNEDPESPVA